MTLEEAIQLANNGDQEAMFQLGQYYWKQEKQYQESQNCYLKGAEAGDVRCMALAALSGNVLAHALRKTVGAPAAAECVRDLETCLSWAAQARANGGKCDSASIETELGVCCFLAALNEENEERSTAYLLRARELLPANHPAQDPEARLYLAFALNRCSRLDGGMRDLDSRLYVDLLTDICENHRTEVKDGAVACYYLGAAYLMGNGCKKDDNKAYQWMATAQQMGFDCQEMLRGFKKKLMGGYVYKG